jgi:sterol-4alpha-carboxylate 3-dehydrogenase (decarboxylating)
VLVATATAGHLLAEAALLAERPKPPSQRRVSGEAFCISNGEPMRAGDFHDAVGQFYTARTGTPFTQSYLPRNFMFGLARIIELLQYLTRGKLKGDVAMLTPAMFAVASLSYTFSYAKARERLGYEPLYTVHEALQRTVHLWHEHRASAPSAQ